MSCAVSLIALGIGYLVFVQAAKEKEGMKLLGQIIGIVVMIGALASGFYAAKCKHGGYGKAPMCPFSTKAADPAQQ